MEKGNRFPKKWFAAFEFLMLILLNRTLFLKKMSIRQPIVSVLGHVDHGKTSILDVIRHSTVASREAGGITQHIGATEVPVNVIKDICKGLIKTELKIPGLLFIDTPGHEAFTNLRKRGGSIADLAVVVVDVREGFKPQTIETLEILKTYRTPFILAANKIDLLTGWKTNDTKSFMESFAQQQDFVKTDVETKVYELVGKLSEFGMESERFDRVTDFTKQVSIVPVSAKSGEGIAELLMVLSGLSQRFLEKKLEIEVTDPGKGSILEVKEELGLGKTLDVVLYDGVISKGDKIILSGLNGPIETHVKALLKPKPLDEMRDPKDKFSNIGEVYAASGLKVVAPGVDEALPGGLIYVSRGDGSSERIKEEILAELEAVRFEREEEGVIVKADTLGSLEAILKMLSDMEVNVRKADIGAVTKKDVIEAESLRRQKAEFGVILAFNTTVMPEAAELANETGVKIMSEPVIYKLLEDYEDWAAEAKRTSEFEVFSDIPYPGKVRFLEGCSFRNSNPAVIGIEVLEGRLKVGTTLMKPNGDRIGKVESIEDKGEKLEIVKKGSKVAVAINGPVIGRNINEKDIFYSFVSTDQYETMMNRARKYLDEEEMALLKEIRKIVKS